jgi:hypothetical protein
MGVAVLLALAMSGAGQAPSGANTAQLVRDWLSVSRSRADAYVIYPADRPDKRLKRLPDEVFRHTQAIRGDDIGAVWLWVQDDGRPAAIGCIFAYSGGAGGGGYRRVVHEFHSVAEEPLMAVWEGRSFQSPAKPGMEWRPIPGASVPAESPAQRGRQLAELARQFQGHEIDPKGGRWELRLVSRPVYRYELKSTETATDGALFVFCQGTDPEIFLSIEARRTPAGQQWVYACTPFSDYSLYVRHRETEIWRDPRTAQTKGWVEVKELIKLSENAQAPKGGER